ncbi:Non-specific serine/threonine protein kinase [Phlyctochytrium planicorne]|nr:Non-specific serine/threonine protein kinase [Phlyctochytrium planicorne]
MSMILNIVAIIATVILAFNVAATWRATTILQKRFKCFKQSSTNTPRRHGHRNHNKRAKRSEHLEQINTVYEPTLLNIAAVFATGAIYTAAEAIGCSAALWTNFTTFDFEKWTPPPKHGFKNRRKFQRWLQRKLRLLRKKADRLRDDNHSRSTYLQRRRNALLQELLAEINVLLYPHLQSIPVVYVHGRKTRKQSTRLASLFTQYAKPTSAAPIDNTSADPLTADPRLDHPDDPDLHSSDQNHHTDPLNRRPVEHESPAGHSPTLKLGSASVPKLNFRRKERANADVQAGLKSLSASTVSTSSPTTLKKAPASNDNIQGALKDEGSFAGWMTSSTTSENVSTASLGESHQDPIQILRRMSGRDTSSRQSMNEESIDTDIKMLWKPPRSTTVPPPKTPKTLDNATDALTQSNAALTAAILALATAVRRPEPLRKQTPHAPIANHNIGTESSFPIDDLELAPAAEKADAKVPVDAHVDAKPKIAPAVQKINVAVGPDEPIDFTCSCCKAAAKNSGIQDGADSNANDKADTPEPNTNVQDAIPIPSAPASITKPPLRVTFADQTQRIIASTSTAIGRLSSYKFDGKVVQHEISMLTGWTCKQTGQKTVLKELINQTDNEFTLDEVENLQYFKGSPRVIQIIESFWQPGVEDSTTQSRMIMMERCSMDLNQYNESTKPTEDTVRFIAFQLAKAIENFHAEGYIHADIKPGNILVNVTPKMDLICLKVTDLGTSMRLKSTQGFMGTWSYIPLEVLEHERITPMMDWFAMGVTLFDLTTDALTPFPGNDDRTQRKSMTQHRLNRNKMHDWIPTASLAGVLDISFTELLAGLLEVDVEKRMGHNNDISSHAFFSNIPTSWQNNIFDATNTAEPFFGPLKPLDQYGVDATNLSTLATDEFPVDPSTTPAATAPAYVPAPRTNPYHSFANYMFDGVVIKTSKANLSGWTFMSTGERLVLKAVQYPEERYDNEGSPQKEFSALKALRGTTWVVNMVSCFTQFGADLCDDTLCMIHERLSFDLTFLLGHRPLNPREIQFISYGVAQAIKQIHDKGYLHRNINSGNILVNVTGDFKLINLKVAGFSEAEEPDADDEVLGFCNEVGYRAPEMLHDLVTMFESDWYTLGVLMFEMSTRGKLPYGTGTSGRLAMLDKMLKGKMEPWVPTVPMGEDFENLMRGLLAIDDSRLGSDPDEVMDHDYFANIPESWTRNVFDADVDLNDRYLPLLKNDETYEMKVRGISTEEDEDDDDDEVAEAEEP